MSEFTTLVYGDNSRKHIANFTTTSLEEAADTVNTYLKTLEHVDVSEGFVKRKFNTPTFMSDQHPPRADGQHSVPIVAFRYRQDGRPTSYYIDTTIHDKGCERPIHKDKV
jgi:hypothetical protein